ncbi:hypothetical protein [Acinetobacter sp. 1125_18A]|uniref:hypothetical protein n=1 Tax=Acinetobacter sp. 1125_18A TaxID=2605959 RepID=UPI004059318B
MKNKFFHVGSIALVLIISVLAYKSYTIDNKTKNIKYRVEPEQDAQVKNNESMISKSLENLINNQNTQIESKKQETTSINSSDTFIMSNHPITKQEN